MSLYLDSSVLVRLSVEAHDDFEATNGWLSGVPAQTQFLTSTHALAEVFRAATGYYSIPEADISAIIAGIRAACTVAPLIMADYTHAFAITFKAGLGGASVYDGLHTAAALRLRARKVVACDEKSFPKMLPDTRWMNPLKP